MPRTRYADADGVDIAYQVLGDGPVDLLLFTGFNIPIDCMDEDPRLARYLRRLASFGRLIRFDRRGMGLSERGTAAAPPTKEQWADDGLAVLDAIGSEHAFLIGPSFSSAEALILSHRRPDRVSGLVILDGAARWLADDDYPMGVSAELAYQLSILTTETDAVDRGLDNLRMLAPSVADDVAFRAWFDRAGNLAATPAMARAILAVNGTSDVRHLLPETVVPTLVVSRTDNPVPGLGEGRLGRYLAEQIPGAQLLELPGPDLIFFVGDTATMLDEIEEFVTGARGGAGSERVLATMLFTDIVGSTSRVAELGDDRWRDLLERHDQTVRAQVTRYGGRAINTAGDGFLATFDSPTTAMECAVAVRQALRASGLDVRAGIHTGEVEVRGADIAGLAVHIAARIAALAGPGEVLVSEPVPHLVLGTGRAFEDRGLHELRGVPGQWRVHALVT